MPVATEEPLQQKSHCNRRAIAVYGIARFYVKTTMLQQRVGVARFFDASICRDTFAAIRIAILFFTIGIFFFFFHNDFHLGRKET